MTWIKKTRRQVLRRPDRAPTHQRPAQPSKFGDLIRWAHPDFHGWHSAQRIAKALESACEMRGYALMLNMGTARADTHLLTWNQVDQVASYSRHKTGVAVEMALSEDLQKALAAMPRTHLTVINTEYGRPLLFVATPSRCGQHLHSELQSRVEDYAKCTRCR